CPGAASAFDHGLHVASGSAVFPLRVCSSTGAVVVHDSLPHEARRPASSALLVHVAPAPPTPRTSWYVAGSEPTRKRRLPAATIAETCRDSTSATRASRWSSSTV